MFIDICGSCKSEIKSTNTNCDIKNAYSSGDKMAPSDIREGILLSAATRSSYRAHLIGTTSWVRSRLILILVAFQFSFKCNTYHVKIKPFTLEDSNHHFILKWSGANSPNYQQCKSRTAYTFVFKHGFYIYNKR
jgi:hypothetical protein